MTKADLNLEVMTSQATRNGVVDAVSVITTTGEAHTARIARASSFSSADAARTPGFAALPTSFASTLQRGAGSSAIVDAQ